MRNGDSTKQTSLNNLVMAGGGHTHSGTRPNIL